MAPAVRFASSWKAVYLLSVAFLSINPELSNFIVADLNKFYLVVASTSFICGFGVLISTGSSAIAIPSDF